MVRAWSEYSRHLGGAVDVTFRELATGGSFFEAPRWHDGRWWASDFHRHSVFAIDPAGHAEVAVEVPAQPGGLGWMPDGSLLVASMRDRRVLRQLSDGTLVEHADLTAVCPGFLNDMLVDGAGRAYVGNFGYDVAGG